MIKGVAPSVNAVKGEWELYGFRITGTWFPTINSLEFEATDIRYPTMAKHIFLNEDDFSGILELPIDKQSFGECENILKRFKLMFIEFQKNLSEYTEELKSTVSDSDEN